MKLSDFERYSGLLCAGKDENFRVHSMENEFYGSPAPTSFAISCSFDGKIKDFCAALEIHLPGYFSIFPFYSYFYFSFK